MAKAPSQTHRVRDEAAFVIQTWPWKETSLLVEMLTLNHGKVVMVARGAKRSGSQFRGLLSPFLPLKISYHGTNEVKTLSDVAWMGGFVPIAGDALFAGFYVNELLVRLLPREDAMPDLFASYVQVLHALASDKSQYEKDLRVFELELLEDLGYGLPKDEGENWVWTGSEMKVAREVTDLGSEGLYLPAELLAKLKDRDFSESTTRSLAKRLFRSMIQHWAGDKPLQTRRILHELKHL